MKKSKKDGVTQFETLFNGDQSTPMEPVPAPVPLAVQASQSFASTDGSQPADISFDAINGSQLLTIMDMDKVEAALDRQTVSMSDLMSELLQKTESRVMAATEQRLAATEQRLAAMEASLKSDMRDIMSFISSTANQITESVKDQVTRQMSVVVAAALISKRRSSKR